ncbi:hypothetical protein BJ170DRAFT_596673 [Xylariales sp. AK1849]|nr:hypothetical protein BJ170DRAFT_596673 [Xylariales sp. AK1849]
MQLSKIIATLLFSTLAVAAPTHHQGAVYMAEDMAMPKGNSMPEGMSVPQGMSMSVDKSMPKDHLVQKDRMMPKDNKMPEDKSMADPMAHFGMMNDGAPRIAPFDCALVKYDCLHCRQVDSFLNSNTVLDDSKTWAVGKMCYDQSF